MGQLVLKDNAASTLAVPLTATAGSGQTVTVAGAGAKFPTVAGTDWSYLTLFDGAGNIEPMKVTAHAAGSTSFTVTRGSAAGITGIADGDVKAWAATTTGVACRLISQVVTDINAAATSAAASASAAAASVTLSGLGTTVNSATSKTTPVDTDEIPLADSAASWVLKKITWANLKAALQAITWNNATNATNATNLTGTTTAAIPTTTLGSGTADATTFLRGDRTFQAIAVPAQIQPISASVGSGALTISASALTLAFRSTTLGSGAVTTVTGTPANLVVPSTATLGTVNAVQSRLAVLAMNNAGTIELAVVNIAGGNDLSETGVISTTTIAGGSNAANVIYSTTGRSSLAYRVIGYIESTQATAGTWATAPSTIQGAGGNAVTAMSSLGYGQTWQNVTGSRAVGTTYYNTTGKPILVSSTWSVPTMGVYMQASVNGAVIQNSDMVGSGAGLLNLFFLVPSGNSYSVAASGGSPSASIWSELR